MTGYGRLNPHKSIQSTLIIVFTLCISSSSSLASLYFKSSPLFGSTSKKTSWVVCWHQDILRSLLLDGVLSGRPDIGLVRRTWPTALLSKLQTRTVRRYAEEGLLLRPGHGPFGHVPRTVRASTENTVRWFVPVFDAQIDVNNNVEREYTFSLSHYSRPKMLFGSWNVT
jgi:hypothetical protein